MNAQTNLEWPHVYVRLLANWGLSLASVEAVVESAAIETASGPQVTYEDE